MDVEVGDYFHYNKNTMNDEKIKTGNEKPERKSFQHMTSLSGNRMVPKTHGRIVFRGVIDTLEAEVIEAQVLAAGLGEKPGTPEPVRSAASGYCGYLGEILDYLRSLMAAEVTEMPLPPPFLFGMDAEELHRKSYDPLIRNGVPPQLPAYTQGPLAVRLNTLRAKVREAELLAVRVFGPGVHDEEEPGNSDGAQREDIILALNRLSSALWWLYCEWTRQLDK
ncbi:MAG: hypothetical protein FWC45_01575 [Treponema sp.]|nr:hypothetical protein [Treponema sp.]